MGCHEMALSPSRAHACEVNAESMPTCPHPRHPDEAEERDALMNEERYAVRQSIPQAQMLAGLMMVAKCQW